VLGGLTNGTVQTAASFYGEVLDTIYTVRDFNESPNALLWPSHLARIYAKAADTTNQPMRQPPDVEQIEKYVTNQIPSGFTQGTGTLMSDVFVGDFSQLLVGKHSPRLRWVKGAVCDQAVAGTGGLHGVPVMALRGTVMAPWPCLRAVSM
jgi:hypothetical protein